VKARRLADLDPDEPDVARLQLAVDFETASADQVFTGQHEGAFLRLLAYGNVGVGYHVTTDPGRMREILEGARELLTHNGWQFDLIAAAHHLKLEYPALLRKTRDTLIEAKLELPPASEIEGGYGLDELGERFLGEGKSTKLKDLAKEFHGYDLIPTTDARYREYARQDVVLTDRLAAIVVPPDPEYLARERRVAGMAGLLSIAGVAVDLPLLAERLQQESERLEAIRRTLIDDHGLPEWLPLPATKRPRKVEPVRTPAAKPWSTKGGAQRLAELAKDVGATEWPTTSRGALSVTADTLRAMAESYPDTQLATVASLIVEAGSTSIPGQLKATVAPDGRVHPIYSISTATGRWSSSSPNVLGVGKRSAKLLADRDLLIADEGNVFASVDLSGIDARCVAGLSGDREYAKMFEPGVDIHTEIADLFFGTRNAETRDAAKTVAHGINYGRGPKAIAKMTGRPVDEVAGLVDAYFARFRGIAEWHKRIRRDGERGLLLPTGSGRSVRVDRDHAYTEAPARLAQSAARDLAMTGLLNVLDAGLIDTVSLFVHDELVLQAPPDEIADLVEDVAALMSFEWRSPSGLVIPIVAEAGKGTGRRWSDCYRK
jgi:DNA polymerase-1